jgi:hypothetical protein
MNNKDLERIKSILKSEDFKREVIEKYKQEQEKLRNLIKVKFPEHASHTQEEGDCEYFDAMFVSVDMKCSCGETLKITREMI